MVIVIFTIIIIIISPLSSQSSSLSSHHPLYHHHYQSSHPPPPHQAGPRLILDDFTDSLYASKSTIAFGVSSLSSFDEFVNTQQDVKHCHLGKDGCTKSDVFSEKIQTAFDPPPHFRKIMLQMFYNGYGRIYARRYEGQIV